MMKWKNHLIIIGLVILITLVISGFICMMILVGEQTYSLTEYEEIRLVGKITEVIPLDETMIITFNGNETYEVNYPAQMHTDLTVNSEMIVTLRKYTFQGIFVKSDDAWVIHKIIKIPVNP